MANVPFINYHNLTKEFYTIDEVCDLFKMTRKELREKCERYGVEPRRNEIGEVGFPRYDVRKLHNLIYHEEEQQRQRHWSDDLWS